jgi:dTDP-4-amino-4,6-dideoxy-D-galactose acyltransferase
MKDESICVYLEWDSKFFGQRIARSNISRLTEKSLTKLSLWCDANRIDCLYFLADSSDPQTPEMAQQNKFQLVDIRMTLDRSFQLGSVCEMPGSEIRSAKEGDISALRNIARTSHRESRFYYDANFPRALCDTLYELWIEKSYRGWAQSVLVGEDSGEPAGYITCHMSPSDIGHIGLVGVKENAQGKGLGKALVRQALLWFKEQGVEKVSVVTQGRNVRAQRLYQQNGFCSRSVELWYHRWFHR